ncbi:MAG: hypothetical protein HPY72_08705 [Anaerolineae bacterium]|nr:hypothetical protein [Anaerolineae bacterium]
MFNKFPRPFQKTLLPGVALLLWMGLAACEGGPRVKMAPGYEATSTPVSAQADVMGTPKPTKVPPTPTPEPLTLDNNRYSLPSRALVFQIPLGWTLTSESGNYARFEAPDKTAWMEAAVESSGYALPAENFQIYTENMRQALYANADSQNLLERQSEESRAVYVTSFSKEGVFWYAYDVFIQKEKAIYSFSFQTVQRLWDAYLPGFGSVVASAETNTGYVSADMIYSFMRSYASPNSQFTLTIPMSWTFTLGQDKLKNALLDMVVSPDGNAGVTIVAYNAGEELKNKDVGQVSIPIIKELEDQELHIRSTDLLNDGRIRVNWQIDGKGIQGYSFFWQDQSIVYIFTLKYADKYAGTYKEVMDNIGDSFRFPGES